jgi:hypothetical protein
MGALCRGILRRMRLSGHKNEANETRYAEITPSSAAVSGMSGWTSEDLGMDIGVSTICLYASTGSGWPVPASVMT